MALYPREVCGIPSRSGIPQTSLGLRGHLITNLPQAMLLLINNAFLPAPAKHECQAPKIWVPRDQPVSGSSP